MILVQKQQFCENMKGSADKIKTPISTEQAQQTI